MKVSVVIPTFNRANYIREAVASVLAQTYQDFEIVIVDDGSTDDTAGIVQALHEPRISYLTQDHRGVSAAVDLGWRAARGEYIARLDSDDRWLPSLLDELVPVLDSDATADVVYARAQGMDADGNALPQLIGAAERFPGETLKSLIYGDFVCPGAVLVRRSAIERVGGYDASLIANEDWDLWIRIAQGAHIRYIPGVLAHYRFHPQNLTRTTSERMERVMQDRVRVLDKFFAGEKIPQDILDIKPIAYRNLYLDWTIRYLERREFRQAFGTFRRAYAFAPSRIAFLPRAFALAIFYLFLSKTTWGVRWVEAWSKRRRADLKE